VLAENGLGSPSCRENAEAPPVARENCATSGFAAAPAPTGDYAFDVHIDTGLAHFSNYLEAAAQDAAQWAWMALVALVRGLLATLEWCYSLDLLGRALLGQVADALRSARETITTPGLAIAMTIASVLAVYHGLLRRRVAQTLGQVLAMFAMMVGGLWTIVDPVGSVGEVATWVNRASLGALGAVAAGTPGHPGRTLAEDLKGLFADVVSGPWCFLEFGDERWCRDPRLLDARLRKAALRVAGEERTLAGHGEDAGAERRARLGVAWMLENARDNGDLFLALPANGVARNSINESGSLLSALCGGSTDATRCTGPTAAEAEFRTQHGTWPRVVGLLLIWLGALGMLALFGWIGLRLLAAAVLSLFLILLAPAAVLAPALGDGGRGLFRAWATRLLGALTAKLVYSLLLGATLLLTNLLAGLTVLGWWMQWMLVSAGWWLVFRERQDLLGMARVGEGAPWAGRAAQAGAGGGAMRPGTMRRARERALHRTTDAAVVGAGRFARRAVLPPPLSGERRAQLVRQARRRAHELGDAQALATLEYDRRVAGSAIADAPQTQAEISDRRAQLARVQLAQHAAHARPAEGPEEAGADSRHAARLAARAERLEAEIAEKRDGLTAARRLAAATERAREREGRAFGDAQLRQRARFLDEQTELPDKGRANEHGERRDYRHLAALAGQAEQGWDELDAHDRRRATLRIDAELAKRERLERSARAAAEGSELGPRQRRQLDRRAQRTSGERPPGSGERAPQRRDPPSPLLRWLEEERQRDRQGGEPPTLAERARAARELGPPAATREGPHARRRRQFGRDQRGGSRPD
jgi:hypothetical protein